MLEGGKNLARLIGLDEDGFGFGRLGITFEGFVDLVSDGAKKISPHFAANLGCQRIGLEAGYKALLNGVFGNLAGGRKTVSETIEIVAVVFKELRPVWLHILYVLLEGQNVTKKGNNDIPPERRCPALRCSCMASIG